MWELGRFANRRRLIKILFDVSLKSFFSVSCESSMCVGMPFNENPQGFGGCFGLFLFWFGVFVVCFFFLTVYI